MSIVGDTPIGRHIAHYLKARGVGTDIDFPIAPLRSALLNAGFGEDHVASSLRCWWDWYFMQPEGSTSDQFARLNSLGLAALHELTE